MRSQQFTPGTFNSVDSGQDKPDAILPLDVDLLHRGILVMLQMLKAGFTFEELLIACGAVSVGHHLTAQDMLYCLEAGAHTGKSDLVEWEDLHKVVKECKVPKITRTPFNPSAEEVSAHLKNFYVGDKK